MEKIKDSMGNELPKNVFLQDSDMNKLGEALKVNSFLLAAKTAMSVGKTVIYDKERKQGTIHDSRGGITIIEH